MPVSNFSRADASLLQAARDAKAELFTAMLGGISAAAAPVAGTGGGTGSLVSSLPAGGNIVGVGYGAKVTAGAGVEGTMAVRVYVRAKVTQSSLSPDERVPPDVAGIPTDVIPVGDIFAHARPTPCGVSVGHVRITAGTLGCLVILGGGTENHILSNNHVLANSNAAALRDNIMEPGPLDGGTVPIAELTDFQLLDFTGAANHIDAAVARVLNPGEVTPDILGGIGRVGLPVTASLYQSVRKHGRTTRHTIGVIMDLSADIKVRYGTDTAAFEDQIAIVGVGGGPFSSGGDSGSLIVDAVAKEPVALLFAGGTGMTFANPIAPVLTRFNAAIV